MVARNRAYLVRLEHVTFSLDFLPGRSTPRAGRYERTWSGGGPRKPRPSCQRHLSPNPAVLYLRYSVHLPDAPAVSARCRARRVQVAARGPHDRTRALRLSMHAARDDCLELTGWVVVRKPMTPERACRAYRGGDVRLTHLVRLAVRRVGLLVAQATLSTLSSAGLQPNSLTARSARTNTTVQQRARCSREVVAGCSMQGARDADYRRALDDGETIRAGRDTFLA
jgi:hypothetical protein